jgi:hypothetical protein
MLYIVKGACEHSIVRWFLTACAVIFLWAAPQSRAADTDVKLDSITVDGDTYSNVVVFSTSPTHISISHSRGMANIKVKSLDLPTQRKLGYVKAEEPVTALSLPAITRAAHDPRLQEMQNRYRQNVEEFIQQLDPTMGYKLLALIAILYLFFCYCCWQICRKTCNRGGIFVWLPGFQMIPLLRAAGMSPWLFLLLFVPGINLFVTISWAFRICRVRQKSAFLAILLLLPGTNVLAFVYLALSGYGPEALEEEQQNSKIKLGFQPS